MSSRILSFLLATVVLAFAVSAVYGQQDAAPRHWERGNAYYERARFDSAAWEYEQILSDSLCDAKLYYNLGNAYFRLQQYPRAILNYERALKWDPKDENVAFNLALARSFTVDKLDTPEPFPFLVWWESFCTLLTIRGWAFLGFAFLLLTVLSVLFLRFFVSRLVFQRLFVIPVLSLLLFFATLALSLRLQNRALAQDTAIIMQSVVSVKGSPDVGAKDLFLLHAGTKITIIQKIGTWYEIQIPDGHQGWVEESILQLI